MFHATLMPLTLICFMLVEGPLSAADRLVDGVPLPGDVKTATVVETDPTELRQWAGAWVGAWGGTLKHVLLVESVNPDGLAQVVYAIGDNPWLGIRRGWSRHEATLSGRHLTIFEAGFSATYDLNDQGGLNATYTRGKIVSHAAMTKTDLTTLLVPDAVVPWTRSKSELLRTALIEDGKPVNLEVVIFRPDGVGPFPLAMFNHGSTGRGTNFDRPTLWLYGDQDPFYEIQHSRNNFMLFQSAGGQGTFLEFNVPVASGHAVLSAPELWEGPVAEYLSSLTDAAKKE